MTRCAFALSLVTLLAGAAGAAEVTSTEPGLLVTGESFVLDGGDIEAAETSIMASVSASPALDPQTVAAPAPRPMAFEYSDGYRTRLKIHKYASFATLPLFVAQYAVGQKLYDGNASDGTRSAHSALAVSTAALFGVNTVTGVWNLYEGRKDPNKSTKRKVHGILMLAADAGFVATGMLAPDDDEGEGEGGSGGKSTHRTVALASMGVATVAYLIMLIH